MKYSFVVFLLLIQSILKAQDYDAPIFTCAQRVSGNEVKLIFAPPINTCGPFISINIFRATQKNGPYTLLTQITNESIGEYSDLGLDANTEYYYYLKSNYNCPGRNSKSSDTFESARPTAPKITKVTVENGKVVVYWDYNPSKKIQGYRIDWIDNMIIGRIDNRLANTFTDTVNLSLNSSLPRLYAVNAMDSCSFRGDNTLGVSGNNFPHSPIKLTAVENKCDGTITLNWTPYVGWGVSNSGIDTVKNYKIKVRKNNLPETTIAIQEYNNRSFIFTDFIYGDSIHIRIEAEHPSLNSITSFSNIYSTKAELFQKPKILEILSTKYLDKNIVEIDWYCDSNAIFRNFGLQVVDLYSNTLIKTIRIPNPTQLGNGYFRYIDSFAPNSSHYRYEVFYEDNCNQEFPGIDAHTVFLKTEQLGLYKNKLMWEESIFPENVLFTVHSFEVWLSIDGGEFAKLADLGPNNFEFEHVVENLRNYKGVFCYQIRANYEFDTVQPIAQIPFSSWSRMSCITQRTVAHIPNVFKVNGVTPMFKPMLIFYSGEYFKMQIFNRWGIMIYETQDPELGWNGNDKNGNAAAEDFYSYIIEYRANDGRLVTRNGNVMLLK